jgi:hypothetical protein
MVYPFARSASAAKPALLTAGKKRMPAAAGPLVIDGAVRGAAGEFPIVDNALAICGVTPLEHPFFKLWPGAVGRQISGFQTKSNRPGLECCLRVVNETLAEGEIEVADGQYDGYSLRVRPYRTAENKIDGAVITLVDIHEVKRLASLELERVTQSLRKPGKQLKSAAP